MSHPLVQRWQALARELSMTDSGAIGEELVECYSEGHRHFHGMAHLTLVLDLLDELNADARLRLAAWFHDAVYYPGRSSNERRSAALARQRLAEAGLPQADTEFVARAVMATAGHKTAVPAFEPLLDADLAVLGARPDVYESYRHAIRQEFAIVPAIVFRRSRARFLRLMLERPAIFRSPACRLRFEAQARRNLQRELDQMHGGH
jgi:predicted metal-dependent HD superfamily phosphohydrolase